MSKDSRLIKECISNIKDSSQKFKSIISAINPELHTVYPIDNGIVNSLENIRTSETDQFFLFHEMDKVVELWNDLIEKSIICLRFFDKREPFLDNPAKYPAAYGINDLKNYFKKYTKFEEMLYGGAKYYRDHIIHVFRVWMLGINSLLTNDCKYLDSINIAEGFVVNDLEKISIWTLIALTHDLGYPLEKSQGIIESTRKMMQSFVANPSISMDLSFNGVQNSMNDFVLRFMSSKMNRRNNGCVLKDQCTYLKDEKQVKQSEREESQLQLDDTELQSQAYVSRLQSKYYFKFQKSLEDYKHGTISAIIIYKLLLFFLESDFTINEDYEFNHEEARQFYIRREILRSIASHTCPDIYHLKISSFAILLIITDDCQEWGRKSIAELYTSSKINNELDSINFLIEDRNEKVVDVNESYSFGENQVDTDQLSRILKSQYNQFCNYISLFRDGQDTKNRDFSYKKTCKIIFKDTVEISYVVEFTIANKEKSSFKLRMECSQLKSKYQEFGRDFLNKVFTSKETGKVYLEDGEDTLNEKTKTLDFCFVLPKPDDKIE